MKKIFTTLLLTVVLSCSLMAQDATTLRVTPYIPNQVEPISDVVKNALTNKLARMVTATGFAQADGTRFALMPRIVVIDKQVQASAPPMIVMRAEITFYLGNVENGERYCSFTKEYKGMGQTETKAYVSLVNNIQPKDKDFVNFMNEGRQKILDYYNQKAPQIMAQARSLATGCKYDEAISILADIPEECTEAYLKATEMIGTIYQEKVDKEGEELYSKAAAAWAADQSYNGAEKAAVYLGQINPWSSAAKKGTALTYTISKRLKELEDREWQYALNEQKHQQQLELNEQKNKAARDKQLIQAARDVAVAQAKRPVYNYNVVWW